MELNKIKFLINSNGTYLDTILPPITANEDGRTIVQVIAPFPITDIVSVNYSIRPIQATVKGSYLVPTGKFGKDVLADDYTHFQTVADWNVFEIPINAVALEYISKYRAGLVLVSFAITQLQTPYFATNYLGLFSNTQPISAPSYNDGDYFIANEYNFTDHDITWAKGDYAYFYNGKWNKGKSVLKASTPSIELPVDPSLKDAPQLEYDEDVALLLAQDLGLLTQRVSQAETDIESAENDINEIDGRVGVNETDIYNLESDVGNLQSDKADKTELVPINNELLRLEQDKADKTYVDAQDQALQSQIEGNDNDILSPQSTKVPKTTTIIGLDLQDNILIGEFKTALGNATQSVAGLLSAEDKTHLDGLVALLETSDGNNIVDTIGEILAIFQNYPEGADLVTVLQGKVDKVAGKELSTNDFTDLLKSKLDSLLDGTQYYDKTYIDALKDKNGWESELLGTLSNNETIALSIINQYDEIQMYAKDTLGVVDNENIRPNLMQSGDSVYFFDDTQAFIMVDTVFGFYAPVGYTLQVVGIKYTELVASDVATSEVGVSVQDKLDEIATEQNNLKNKDIEHEKDLIDHEQRIDSIEAITRKQDSDIASVDDDGMGILHMGKDVAETTVTTKIDGLLLDAPQLVTNGDFSDGTTGWGNVTSHAAVVNKQLVFNNTSSLYNSIHQDFNVNLNDKIYFSVNILVADDISGFRINYGQNNWAAAYHVSSGGVGKKSGIFTAYQGETVRLLVGASAGLSNTYDDVYVFNISTLIANKQYSPLYNTTFNLMTDEQIKAQMDLWVQDGTLPNGIMSVDMDKRVTSVGKNLWNNVMELGSILTTTGLNTSSTTVIRPVGYQAVKPSTTYVATNINRWYLYGIDFTFISTGTTASFTTTTNTFYIRAISVSTDLSLAIQLEQGSTATTYEPYRSSSMYLDSGKVGYSFEGTTDSIEFRNGEALFINRVNDTQDGLRTTPIETPISVVNNATAYPNGTFLIEDVVRRIGVYNAGITVDKAIKTLDNIYKLNDDGSSTKLAVSGATVAGDGLSFTHTSLSNGDFVWFDYYYQGTNVKGLSTVYYYGDKMIVADTTTGTVYKIIFTIDNGVITVDKVVV